MKGNTCVIIVPIYKQYHSLDSSEMISLNNAIQVFASRDIVFVTNKDIDVSLYLSQLNCDRNKLKVQYFSKKYFTSTIAYNELMLSSEFYHRFRKYDYMMIYQLDAYVFEDKLDYWMSKNYDYIGAPWFANYGSYESGDELWEVGNGGLSLRKVEFYYDLLKYRGILFCGIDLRHGFYEFIKSIAKCLGYHNTISWHKKHWKGTLNEDVFLSHYLKNITNRSRFTPALPTPIEASAFAFEKSPTYLYELNKRQLPMGCHAFMKYEYDTFWCRYI